MQQLWGHEENTRHHLELFLTLFLSTRRLGVGRSTDPSQNLRSHISSVVLCASHTPGSLLLFLIPEHLNNRKREEIVQSEHLFSTHTWTRWVSSPATFTSLVQPVTISTNADATFELNHMIEVIWTTHIWVVTGNKTINLFKIKDQDEIEVPLIFQWPVSVQEGQSSI